MTYKKAGRISFILIIWENMNRLSYVGIGITMLGAIIEYLFHRCPYCGATIGTFIGTKYCRKCGREIE